MGEKNIKVEKDRKNERPSILKLVCANDSNSPNIPVIKTHSIKSKL
jgi:hypothetical protein